MTSFDQGLFKKLSPGRLCTCVGVLSVSVSVSLSVSVSVFCWKVPSSGWFTGTRNHILFGRPPLDRIWVVAPFATFYRLASHNSPSFPRALVTPTVLGGVMGCPFDPYRDAYPDPPPLPARRRTQPGCGASWRRRPPSLR